MRPDTAAQCQTDKFEEVRIPQASLIPKRAENYRCMLVWDTRTNRDVGWLMVRKKAVNGMKSEEVAAEMSQCQWRNWNLNISKEDEMCGDDCRETLPDPVKGILIYKAEEASTSLELKSVAARQEDKVKVDFCVQVGTEFFLEKEVLDARRCRSKNSWEPLNKRTKLGNPAVIESSHFDNLEVVGVSANNNENVMKDNIDEAMLSKDSNEKDNSSVRKMKKSKNKTKTSLSEEFNENEKLAHESIKGDNKQEIRKSHSLTLHECPECGKPVKQKSFYMHLRVVHNIKSAKMTLCNICNTRIFEVNLRLHRKIFHPERFQFDLIACSGCQKQVRAVEFDGHACFVEEASTRPAVGEELIKSYKCLRQYKMSETCSDCSVVFSGAEIRYHDCKISSIVRLKRLRIKSKKPVISEVQVLKAGNLMCEDCGKLFNHNGRLDQHDCNETFVEEHYFELNEDDVNLALDKIGEIRESTTSSNVAEFLALDLTKGLKNIQAEVKTGGSLSPANVNEPTCSILPDKIIELSASLTLAKMLESKGTLSTAKIFEPRRSSTPAKIIKPMGSLSPERKLVEPTQDKIVEARGSLSPVEPRGSLPSAKVVGQPPQFLRRGEVFTFTVKLLDINNNSLQIKSVCLTAACRGSSVLQFRLELLQADGSITLQPLWISICSADQPGVLLKCLIPCHIPCRQLGKDQLQFSMSCDMDCDTTDCRYKLVVATKQLVFMYNNFQLSEPEQVQETNEGSLKQLDNTSDEGREETNEEGVKQLDKLSDSV